MWHLCPQYTRSMRALTMPPQETAPGGSNGANGSGYSVRFTWLALLQSSHDSVQLASSGDAQEALEKFHAFGSATRLEALKLGTHSTSTPSGKGLGWLTQPCVA